VFQGDQKRKIDTNIIEKTDKFYLPIERDNKGAYKIKSGKTIYVSFSSDFLLEEADEWRKDCFKIMKERKDLNFIFLTKRIERFMQIVPADWGKGYSNVTIGCSVSTQQEIDTKIALLVKLPIAHKNIILQPLIEEVNISDYIKDVELVIVGGEYGKNSRPLNFDWVLKVRKQCIEKQTSFEFRQCATTFIKGNVEYKLKYKDLSSQAKKANLNIYY